MVQDVDAFAGHLQDDALRHPHAEHWVAGARVTEGGVLAPFAGASCSGSLAALCPSCPSGRALVHQPLQSEYCSAAVAGKRLAGQSRYGDPLYAVVSARLTNVVSEPSPSCLLTPN